VKYLEFLAKVYSNIAGNVVHNRFRQNYIISSPCVVQVSNITCLVVRVV